MLAAAAGALRCPRAAILASPMKVTRHARRLAAPVARPVRAPRSERGRATGRPTRASSSSATTLGWALDDEAAYVVRRRGRAGYRLGPPRWARYARGQVVFHTSHFAALDPLWTGSSHRLGLAYFHGRPGTPGYPEFDRAYEALAARPGPVRPRPGDASRDGGARRLGGCRAGERPPDPDRDRARPLPARRRRRASGGATGRSGFPQDAFVVGSFQKDGVGLGDGLEPKSIKGPDVLVEALDAARRELDELVVLLTGPARGYVRRELERRAVPHVHRLLPTRDELTTAYHALDAYVVASRQEGGPKSVLESMATGVPLVTTRAGQAPDLVVDGENGNLVDVEDAVALAAGLVRVHARRRARDGAPRGRARTADENSHERLAPRWEALLEGFAERPGG